MVSMIPTLTPIKKNRDKRLKQKATNLVPLFLFLSIFIFFPFLSLLRLGDKSSDCLKKVIQNSFIRSMLKLMITKENKKKELTLDSIRHSVTRYLIKSKIQLEI